MFQIQVHEDENIFPEFISANKRRDFHIFRYNDLKLRSYVKIMSKYLLGLCNIEKMSSIFSICLKLATF